MTPKEKAIELKNSMHTEIGWGWYESINCAIVAVDEYIREHNNYSDLKSVIFIFDKQYSIIDRIEFWREVKKELEAMR